MNFILFLLAGTASVAAIQWIKQAKFKKTAEKSGIQVSDESDLRYHVLFSTSQYRLAIELPNLDVFPNKPVRQLLMTDLLRIYIKSLLEGSKDIAVTNMKGWSSEQWSIEMTNRLSLMVAAAHSTAKMEGIPDIILLKFSRWVNPSIDMLFSYVEMIGNSNIYVSNIARTNTLFLIINLLMSTMLGDAERSIRDLNGDISGKIYKGQIIE